MAEAKKEEKSIEDTFGELDLLARKLEDTETPLEEVFPPLQTGNGAPKGSERKTGYCRKKDASDE